MRVLVVDDDDDLADMVAGLLRRRGIGADVANTGEIALAKCAVNDYGVVLLDRSMPGIGGDRVCTELAGTSPRPRIMMLTASGTTPDLVDGLRLGADDYLAKPFEADELLARTLALGRRPSAAENPVIEFADLRIDPAGFSAERAGRPIRLSPKEFNLLAELMRAGGSVVPTERLIERVWDESLDPFSNVVRVTIMNVRRKLGEPAVIETVKGVGYRLIERC